MRWILAFFLLLNFLFASQYKNILLLHSYNKGLVWTDNISKGVEEVLAPYKSYELTTEYMDSKKNDFPKYKSILYKIFYEKLKRQKYDIVIASDNFAVNFVLLYKNRLFKDIPIVFCGLDKDNPGIDIQKAVNEKIGIVLENKRVDYNIELIRKVYPKLKKLYIINGPSPTSMLVNEKIKSVMQRYKDKISMQLSFRGKVEEIQEDFKTLPKNSAILFGSVFRDIDGKYVPHYEMTKVIKSSPYPVFAWMGSHLGEGVVGGSLTRGVHQGQEAAKMAVNYLKNKPKKFLNPKIAQDDIIFDYKILKKFDLSLKNLPKNAKIINEPQSFFEKHRLLVERVFLIFPFVLVFLLIALVNIYKRHKMAKKLAAQSYREQVLLNNANSAIFWIDNDGVIRGCNDAFCELIDEVKGKVIGSDICKLFSSFCQMPTQEQLFTLEDIEFTYKGKNLFAKSKIYLDEDGENGGVVTIITDLSEKKQLEINKQFIIQQSKLSEIGEMLSAIVHQWKVPLVELSAVAHKMQYYHLKRKLKDSDIEKFFKIIMTQIIYMGDTIDGFRAFIRPSNKPILFNIDKGIHEILSILESSMKYNNIEIEYKNEKEIFPELYGYPNEFKQVVLNIINNSKDAILSARDENKKLGLIKLTLEDDEDSVKLSIEDDGKGIDEKSLDKIFNPFFSTKTKGDGFGLYMAKLIIENKMNGKIDAKNLTKGACFSIRLPKHEKDEK